MAQGGSSRKIANGLVAAGAAAVLAVYAAGYERTRSAAEQLEAQSAVRRPAAVEARAARGPEPVTNAVAPTLRTPVREDREAIREVASLAHPAMEPGIATVAAPSSSQPKTDFAPAAPVPGPAPAPTPAVVAVPAVVTPPTAPAAAQPAAKYKDGTYKGWGTCRHGDIEAQVVIEGGRITSASISQCLTRYTCDIIGRLPPQVIQRQNAEVDYVTGATQSANAFYYAVTEALGKAK